MKSLLCLCFLLFATPCFADDAAAADKPDAPPRMPLYEGPAPIGDGQTESSNAWITVHRPEKPNGAAIVICPGGGYGGLVLGAEGHRIAAWLNQHGITGVVLEYRLPAGRHAVPLLDAQRAIRTVRASADKWQLKPDRIGIMGFSAGGHLASTAGTHFDDGNADAADAIDRVSCRPDFTILVYPVVSMGQHTHQGSKNNLLGKDPSPELVTLYSNELQVTDNTPPTFIAHAVDDKAVPIANSGDLYASLQQHNIPSQFLELPSGGHGLNGYKGPMWDAWQEQSLTWLAAIQGNWTSWRGPSDSGATESDAYPAKLDDAHTLWRAPLPGKGCSTPIVLNQNIYLTAPIDGVDAVLCFDWSGQPRWNATFGPEDAGKHRNGSGSNASPVTDGSGIFAYFKSGTLTAVELDGTVRWKTNLVDRFGKDTLFWDHGTSPVLTDKHVIMARMHKGESWLAAFDKHSGELAWKVARNYKTPTECDHGYTTPLVIEHNGKQSLLVWGAEHLTIHDATDGQVVWTCGNFNPDGNQLWPAIATPVIVGDMAVICYGRNDKGAPRLYGIRLSGNGDVTASNHVWMRDDISCFVPTPAVYQDHVYLVRDRGEVECIDPASGATIWSDAFPKSRSNFYASPLIAGGNLYAPREDGMVFIASVADDSFQLLSENDMQESVIGSPVPAAGRIFIRGEKHLFCLAKP